MRKPAIASRPSSERRANALRRFLLVAVALSTAGVMLLALPVGAGANSDKRFVLAVRGVFTGDSAGAGTFSVAGALSDSGSFDTTFTATPKGDNCLRINPAEWTFTTPNGSFTFKGSGLGCTPSPSDPRGIFDGSFKITSGSGIYADLSGKGSETGESDFDDGTFTTLFDGRAHVGR